MSFDFQKQYQHYTVRQLLEIVDRPELYQPDAVAAATDLLVGRDPEEIAAERARLNPTRDTEPLAEGASIFDEADDIPYNSRRLQSVKIALVAFYVLLSISLLISLVYTVLYGFERSGGMFIAYRFLLPAAFGAAYTCTWVLLLLKRSSG